MRSNTIEEVVTIAWNFPR